MAASSIGPAASAAVISASSSKADPGYPLGETTSSAASVQMSKQPTRNLVLRVRLALGGSPDAVLAALQKVASKWQSYDDSTVRMTQAYKGDSRNWVL